MVEINGTGKQLSDSFRTLARELHEVCEHVVKNTEYSHLEDLLKELETCPCAAPLVWNFNAMPILLLQEIVTPYHALNTDDFDDEKSGRLCTVMNILQILVRDTEVKKVFVDARIPYYIYKYLMISSSTPKYETLRIATLGIIAALLQDSDQYIHKQLKTTEIVPLLLKIIDLGSEVSQVLSVSIFKTIIENDDGLNYACQTFDRFSAINLVFNSLASQAIQLRSTDLIKGVLKIYIRLSTKPHIKALLTSKRPEGLFTSEASALMSTDDECSVLFAKFYELVC